VIYVNHGISSAPDATVWAAVRPEKINLARKPPLLDGSTHQPETGPGENVVKGVVKEIAYMGDMSIYLVQLDSGKTVRVTQPNTHRHADEPLTWEDRVWMSWHESSAVVVTE
jgi:putrescine transport system ATP-binding protein